MTTVILVRHGHVEGIRPARFRGRQPLPPSEQGLIEAEMTAQRVVSAWAPTAIYTSSLQRCVATGAAIGRACGVDPIAISDLDDLDYGDCQWKTFQEVEENGRGSTRNGFPRLSSFVFPMANLCRILC